MVFHTRYKTCDLKRCASTTITSTSWPAARMYFIGVTNNLRRRIWEHKNGVFPGFTSRYRCHRLVWFESYVIVELAIAREKQLERRSRAKKVFLIERENRAWADLSENWYSNADPSTSESPLRGDSSARDDKFRSCHAAIQEFKRQFPSSCRCGSGFRVPGPVERVCAHWS